MGFVSSVALCERMGDQQEANVQRSTFNVQRSMKNPEILVSKIRAHSWFRFDFLFREAAGAFRLRA